MDRLKTLQKDEELADLMDAICDVRILPQFVPVDNDDGRLSFNIEGKVFAKDASGGEYILLDDGSVGFCGSEGEDGRIADSIDDFFTLMVNCPYWCDYQQEKHYKDKKSLRKFADRIFEEHVEIEEEEMGEDLREEQAALAEGMGITLAEDVTEILMRFYRCATREPRFISAFKEKDGSVTYGSGSLFEM